MVAVVVGLPCVHGVAGMDGAVGVRAVDRVEEVSVHGIERARVPPQTPCQSRVMSFV